MALTKNEINRFRAYSRIMKLVDEGGDLNKIIKEADEELKKIKIDLKGYSKTHKQRKLRGKKYSAAVSDTTGTEVDMKKLWNEIDGKFNLFVQLVSPKIKELKAYCEKEDQLEFEDIARPGVIKASYNRISFFEVE